MSWLLLLILEIYFNTSYVVIKPFETCAYTARYVNFNTSYVVIKRMSLKPGIGQSY